MEICLSAKSEIKHYFILLAGICDSEIIPKLFNSEKEKIILWTSFYSFCPQLINTPNAPLCSLPYLCTSQNLALLLLPLTSIVLHHKIILLPNSFSPYEIRWRRKLVWAGESDLVSGSHLPLVWGCEAGSPSLPLPTKAAIPRHKKPGKSTHVLTCFSQGYHWGKFLENCLQLHMPSFPFNGNSLSRQ